MNNNKKFLLAVGVLSMLSANVMATNVETNSSGIHFVGEDNNVTDSTYVNVIGHMNTVKNGFDNNVVGFRNDVDGRHNIILGTQSTAQGYDSITIGDNAGAIASKPEDMDKVTGRGAVAIGKFARSDSEYTTALGYMSESDGELNVAIGAHSIAYKENFHKADAKYAGVSNAKGVFSIANGSGYSPMRYMANSPVGANQYEDNEEINQIVNIGEFTRQLQGVAAGELSATSTDAVNGSQLYTEIKEVRETFKIPMDWLENHEGRIQTLENNKTIVEAGDNITVTEDSGTYKVSTNKDLTELNSVSLNDGNNESTYTTKGISMIHRGDGTEPEYHTTYNYNGIRIATNDGNAAPIDEITLTTNGLNNGGKKITNVQKGTNDTDAVNVSQLKEVSNKTIQNENRINDLDGRINNIHQNAINQANHYTNLQVNKGVAKASALAGLKYLDYNPRDKWSFAASVGHYRNTNAVAVGMAYQPNENTMVHGGITLDGKVAYNLGVSFKTGGQKYVNKYDLQDQVKQLQSDNAELRQELAELRSMIEKK